MRSAGQLIGVKYWRPPYSHTSATVDGVHVWRWCTCNTLTEDASHLPRPYDISDPSINFLHCVTFYSTCNSCSASQAKCIDLGNGASFEFSPSWSPAVVETTSASSNAQMHDRLATCALQLARHRPCMANHLRRAFAEWWRATWSQNTAEVQNRRERAALAPRNASAPTPRTPEAQGLLYKVRLFLSPLSQDPGFSLAAPIPPSLSRKPCN